MLKHWKSISAALLIAAVAGFLAADAIAKDTNVGKGIDVPAGHAVATFAGGCFWCVEPPFDKMKGVVSTTSGYTQGKTVDPTYEAVCAGGTGHCEAVQVVYDPKKVKYEDLLTTFWHNIDPTDKRGQFCDKGDSYRSGIYYHNAAQKAAAEASVKQVEKELADLLDGEPVATEILPAKPFYLAEAYHQDYPAKNPIRYRFYRLGCGRDARLEAVWGAKAGH